jgi:NADH-quinone oxidoreductase subunit I
MGRVDFKDIRREQRVLAGKAIPVAVTPRIKEGGGKVAGAKSLIDGMALTLKYLVHPSKVVTAQYPENRATLKFPERYRAALRLKFDENGYHFCTACKMCERACPNASIKVITKTGGALCKVTLDRYVWRQDSCVFCNACVQSCPFDALEMTHDFENAVYDRRLLIYTLNRYAGPHAKILLQHEPALRKTLMEPRDRYGGPVPLNGHALPNVRPLPVEPRVDGPGGKEGDA